MFLQRPIYFEQSMSETGTRRTHVFAKEQTEIEGHFLPYQMQILKIWIST